MVFLGDPPKWRHLRASLPRFPVSLHGFLWLCDRHGRAQGVGLLLVPEFRDWYLDDKKSVLSHPTGSTGIVRFAQKSFTEASFLPLGFNTASGPWPSSFSQRRHLEPEDRSIDVSSPGVIDGHKFAAPGRSNLATILANLALSTTMALAQVAG